MTPLVIAIDQGSSSTKTQVVSAAGTVVGHGTVAVAEAHPAPGWVEQDPVELWDSVCRSVQLALRDLDGRDVAAVGVTNQRESLVVWERSTGRPLAPVVSWQDQRTIELHGTYERAGVADVVRRTSGLPLDPMFSALKARWLLDAVDPQRQRSRRGEICLGTVDSWLLNRITGEHLVDIGNASRTQLLDVTTGGWSPLLLELFQVPAPVLPRIVASDGPFPPARHLPGVASVAIVGAVMGDSHAALFGHGVRTPGFVKATYGTGSSVMALVDEARDDGGTMCRTIAWQRRGESAPRLALEGNIRASGATLAWVARLLGSTPRAVAELAASASSDGVHLVPGFNGLAAPWWDPNAVGMVSGLTLASGPAQLARAALESIAFQVADVVGAVEAAGAPVHELLADGGGSADDVLMQLQADVTGRPVRRSAVQELSGLGVAHLAGLTADLWDDATLAERAERGDRFEPATDDHDRAARRAGWRDAIERARRCAGAPPDVITRDDHRTEGSS